jgi:membrane-associated protease RseP (regulator of RpoE activity)
MSPRTIEFTVGTLLALSVMQAASAQSFLQRITEQLQQNTPREGAPPLQPADDTSVNTPRETLPPPRELSPTPAAARGSLGLRVSDVTDDAIRRYQLVVRRGALITSVEKGSAAERAGLPLGGVIVAVDGRRVDSPEDLVAAVRATRPGRDVEITYYDRDRMSRKMVQLPAGQVPDISSNSERRINPVPTPTTTSPPPPNSLGQQLGGNGQRPLLGRIGSLLDNVVAPAQAIDNTVAPTPTVANRVDTGSEISQLRSQVEQLQRQVESLQKSIDALEKRMAERK